MKRRLFCVIAFCSVFSLQALPPSVQVAAPDAEALAAGETLIRSVKSTQSVGLQSTNAAAQQLLTELQRLQPSYLAEVIKVVPYAGNEGLMERVKTLVLDIPAYVRIPYHSRWGTSPLFRTAQVQSHAAQGTTEVFNCNLHMEPFTAYKATVTATTTSDTFYYTCINEEKLAYQLLFSFTAVKKQKMLASLVVFKDGDYLVLYAVGGAKAPYFPFAQKRVEAAFINRIRDFCSYFLEKL